MLYLYILHNSFNTIIVPFVPYSYKVLCFRGLEGEQKGGTKAEHLITFQF